VIDQRPILSNGKRSKALEHREREVLLVILGGLSNREIGNKMSLPESRVKNLVIRLFSKASVRTRSQLVRVAMDGTWDAARELLNPQCSWPSFPPGLARAPCCRKCGSRPRGNLMRRGQSYAPTPWANIVLAIGSLVATLLLGEVAVRVAAYATSRVPFFVSDSHTGWALKSNLRNVVRVFGPSKFSISTDQDGHRVSYPIGQSVPAGDPTLVVVGDSIAQGLGVNDDQTFPWDLARLTPYRIVNLAVAGYGTDQELIKLEDFLSAHPEESVKDIIVVVFDNDFTDVQHAYDRYLGRSKPRFYVSGQKLIRPPYHLSLSDHLMDISRLFWLLNSKRAQIFAPTELRSEDGVGIVLACLKTMRLVAEARNTQLRVFAYRRLKDPQLISSLEWRDFVVRAGAADLTDCIRAAQGANPIGPDGLHWSAVGNGLVAKIVSKSLGDETTGNPNSPAQGLGLPTSKRGVIHEGNLSDWDPRRLFDALGNGGRGNSYQKTISTGWLKKLKEARWAEVRRALLVACGFGKDAS
jgi:DNA-binding CsgD family transcriptional regulator